MKVMNLTEKSNIYTSNVFLVLGNRNTIKDVNTLVDVGRDTSIIEKIKKAPTGVGKHKVDQVILTHSHYDHTSLLPLIREVFKPAVYAFSQSLQGVDHLLKDGDALKLGDRMFEVIHTPGHSSDSICLYCEEEKVLFTGDTSLLVRSASGTYEEGYIRALERFCRNDIRSIYPGHGAPMLRGCNDMIRSTLKNVRKNLQQVI